MTSKKQIKKIEAKAKNDSDDESEEFGVGKSMDRTEREPGVGLLTILFGGMSSVSLVGVLFLAYKFNQFQKTQDEINAENKKTIESQAKIMKDNGVHNLNETYSVYERRIKSLENEKTSMMKDMQLLKIENKKLKESNHQIFNEIIFLIRSGKKDVEKLEKLVESYNNKKSVTSSRKKSTKSTKSTKIKKSSSIDEDDDIASRV